MYLFNIFNFFLGGGGVNAFRLSSVDFMGFFIQDLREIHSDVCDSLSSDCFYFCSD